MVNICKNCGRAFEVWTASFEHPYRYTESGLSTVSLIDVTVYSCPNCGIESADIPDLDGLHSLIAKDIILTPLPMTGQELRFLRKETRLKPKEFAERLGVDPKTINNWEASEKLSRQTDVTVRVLAATELWLAQELNNYLPQLAAILKYSWGDLGHDIEELAEENTFMGFTQDHEWTIAA